MGHPIYARLSGTSDGGTRDGGTSDGCVDAGSGDGGTDDESEGDDRSALGGSCASIGGSGSLALTGLVVMLALLAMRRACSAGSREQVRGVLRHGRECA
ncbi:hypothetical protein [Myxococcus sp. RHSTA-1-4]|uniref:hypothetical protein n=1 Tax=Myxococcus sp. RHSTA-1-4 TaxID=2874601 RepID=UPI001CBCB74D|nr:hypothetical protein [Myxococcus sp. RHSTA-1-4]MBZ4415250.1 hypothetical protein [Myxococcus sp. RHSTA-1-4]